MMTREWPLSESLSRPRSSRRLAAATLRAASICLGSLARRLGRPLRQPARLPPVLEFYAEAGAPEGALYIDGVLVGTVPGVRRL